jgi:hypothetical protein
MEINKQHIYQFLKEKDKSKYDVIDIVGEISSMTRGDHYKQENLICVTCKVSFVDPSPIDIKIEMRNVCIDEDVLMNYVKELNAITWYESEETKVEEVLERSNRKKI